MKYSYDTIDQLIFSTDRTEDQERNKLVRDAITRWANTIPHHEHDDLGNEIEITGIKEIPLYFLELTGQYEFRKLANVYRPYKGEEIPKQTIFSINEVEPWQYDLRSTDTYINKKLEYPLEKSQYVDTCEVCHGEGKTTCPHCGGKRVEVCNLCGGDGREYCSDCGGSGREACYMCRGSGSKDAPTSCSSCGGSGSITLGDGSRGSCGSCGGSGRIMRRVPCDRCGGSGELKCRTCFGRGTFTCSKCGGSGKVTCSRCQGSGKTTCEKCKGYKRIVRFVILIQEFVIKTFNKEYFPNAIKEKFPEFRKYMKKSNNREIFRQSANSFPHNYLLEPPQFQELWKGLYGSGKNEIVPGSSVMHFQTLCINEKPIYEVAYSFNDKDYTLLVYGTNSLIYAPENPILDECKDFVRQAFDLFKKRRLSKSLHLFNIAKEMDVENQVEDIPVLGRKLKKKINQSYVTGTILSTVLVGYLASLFNLSFFQEARFIMPKLTEWFSSIPEFSFIHPALVTTIFLGMVIGNYRKSIKISRNHFGMAIYRHPFRIMASFLFNVIKNLKSLFILYVLTFSGLILLVSYGIYFISDMVMKFL